MELHTQDGASFRATIADLSVGGCYIEMTIPLPRGTKLKAGIWVGETKCCADCEVAYSAAGIGTGLMFNRISEPDLERIRQFLGTLAEVDLRAMTSGRVGRGRSDLCRVNFEVNDPKPFPHLAFPHSKGPKTPLNCLVFDGESMASFSDSALSISARMCSKRNRPGR